ncbi:MAG: enoyl-CoA hydratase/isomerase family protein [Deltaproteobacteria bacterium]|nr:enoyl-CoA hydratase/isomerase family protein [Deltaproteobacteria bacterium]PWB66140.1 MAG: enoyl-CoA hydratase/isomerase family protein [Deltaproteobacteria bacterium]
MTTYETIQGEVTEDGIGILTLNRPEKRNAISIRMRQEISRCLREWGDSEQVGAVILTGAGSVFSAGFDLSEFGEPSRFDELFDSSSRYHREVWSFPKPLIAAINGPSMGGGFDLATLCDLRICIPSASFGHPEIKFGAPPLFTPLRWIVGDGVARDLVLTGRPIGAEDAFRIGLITRIVAADQLMGEALRIAKVILEAPPETLKFVKTYLASSAGRDFEESFRVEHDQPFQEILLPLARKGLKRK